MLNVSMQVEELPEKDGFPVKGRDEFLTGNRGTGILNSSPDDYEEHRGDFPTRFTGSWSPITERRTSGEPRDRIGV